MNVRVAISMMWSNWARYPRVERGRTHVIVTCQEEKRIDKLAPVIQLKPIFQRRSVLGSIGTENRLKDLCWHRSYPVSDNKTVCYSSIHLDTYESYVRPSDCIVPDVAKVLVKEQTFATDFCI